MKLSLNAVKSNGRELTDTIYLIILQGANQLLPLFVMPFLMIKLGAEGYGFVGFSLSVIQYLVLIVDFGFNLSATKRIAQANDDVDKCNEVFWNVVAAKSLLLVASSVILLVLMLTVPTFQFYSQAIWATWPMLLGSTFTFMWFFQGKGYIRFFSVMNTLSKLALLPLIFVFVKTPDDCSLAAFLQAVVFVGTAIISNIYIYRKRLVQWHTPSWKGIKVELAESFPLFLSTASTSVYTQLIVIVLGFYCTTSEVGKYASADRIMRALCFLLYVPLNQVFFPKISALAVKGKDLAAGLFKQVMLMVILVMCCVSAFLFFGGVYLPNLLGHDYAGIDVYLKILAIAPLAIGFGGVFGQMGLVALGNKYTSNKFRNVYFIAALAAIIMMFVLTPWLGAIGACITVSATELLVAVLMAYNFKKNIGLCLS